MFIKTTLPFYLWEQQSYTGSDFITAILYDTKLTHKAKSYNKDSLEYIKFGPDHADLEIIDGVLKDLWLMAQLGVTLKVNFRDLVS